MMGTIMSHGAMSSLSFRRWVEAEFTHRSHILQLFTVKYSIWFLKAWFIFVWIIIIICINTSLYINGESKLLINLCRPVLCWCFSWYLVDSCCMWKLTSTSCCLPRERQSSKNVVRHILTTGAATPLPLQAGGVYRRRNLGHYWQSVSEFWQVHR